jgi:hypothetical protein
MPVPLVPHLNASRERDRYETDLRRLVALLSQSLFAIETDRRLATERSSGWTQPEVGLDTSAYGSNWRGAPAARRLGSGTGACTTFRRCTFSCLAAILGAHECRFTAVRVLQNRARPLRAVGFVVAGRPRRGFNTRADLRHRDARGP